MIVFFNRVCDPFGECLAELDPVEEIEEVFCEVGSVYFCVGIGFAEFGL